MHATAIRYKPWKECSAEGAALSWSGKNVLNNRKAINETAAAKARRSGNPI
jgi:hypothetical protein